MRSLLQTTLLTLFLMTVPAWGQAATPVVLYTDVSSGPNTGGENNLGIYLSIFGRNFGTDISAIKVFINNTEVGAYKVLGKAIGRDDIQLLTVQPGPGVSSGGIKVVVGGAESNSDVAFTVRGGKIFFVAQSGDDTKGVIGDITKPFRTAQTTFDRTDFVAGDTLVMRGGTWTDIGRFSAFLGFADKAGTSAAPMAVMAYPGESVIWNTQGTRGGSTFYFPSGGGGGVVMSGLRINGNTHDVIQLQSKTDNLRIINNELYGVWAGTVGTAALTGNGKHWKIFGNSIHDNGYTKLMHAIYIDNENGAGAEDIEVAYNHIYNQTGGRGVQLYWVKSTATAPPQINNISIHDNLIHDIDRDGIVVAEDSGNGILIYNNVIYNTGRVVGSALRIVSADSDVKAFNNTFYNADIMKLQGQICFEVIKTVEFKNNLIYAPSGQVYHTGVNSATMITSSNNLWFGAGTPPSFEKNAVNADPLFLSMSTYNLRIPQNSPASGKGLDMALYVRRDYDGLLRSGPVLPFDIGAYEYDPAVVVSIPKAPAAPNLKLIR